MIGYGVIRFLLEFTRQPDPQLGFVVGPFSMGQLLSSLMIVIGIVILVLTYRRPRAIPPAIAPPVAQGIGSA